jgi:hypothetical protein
MEEVYRPGSCGGEVSTERISSDAEELARLLGDLQLVPNGLGKNPLECVPWGSRWLRGEDGRGIVIDGRPLQFLEDADGFPIVSTSGRLVAFDTIRREFTEVM